MPKRLPILPLAILPFFLQPSAFSLPPATAPSDADYAAHLKSLRETLPKDANGGGFTLLIQKPFVVIGDDSPAAVRASAERTIKWAVEHLKKEYFEKDPPDILDVYLFKDKASYDKYTQELFHDTPTTPYGYYSPAHKALIMNIATGGGTLVHEIVHPYVAANFPDCPSWFNEGLGSLYEQSAEKDGRIVGLTNWRLAGLQDAIKRNAGISPATAPRNAGVSPAPDAPPSLPLFKDLCATTTLAFYTKDRGTNYAQSRYLCYYLQEKGLLKSFYQSFQKNHEKDPTGYNTLQEILKEPDMPAFQKRWEAWVLTLKFP